MVKKDDKRFKDFLEKVSAAGLPDIVQAAQKESDEYSVRMPFELMSRLLDVMSPDKMIEVLGNAMSADEMRNGVNGTFKAMWDVRDDLFHAIRIWEDSNEKDE